MEVVGRRLGYSLATHLKKKEKNPIKFKLSEGSFLFLLFLPIIRQSPIQGNSIAREQVESIDLEHPLHDKTLPGWDHHGLPIRTLRFHRIEIVLIEVICVGNIIRKDRRKTN